MAIFEGLVVIALVLGIASLIHLARSRARVKRYHDIPTPRVNESTHGVDGTTRADVGTASHAPPPRASMPYPQGSPACTRRVVTQTRQHRNELAGRGYVTAIINVPDPGTPA